MKSIFPTLLLSLVFCLPGLAENSATLDAQQQARYERLCSSLVAPCCWREPVSIHRSPESLQVREQVAKMIRAGKSDREILDAFTSQYGAGILIEPEGAPARWLYMIPIAGLALGLLGAAWFLARWQRKRALGVEPTSTVAEDDSEWDW